jgi:tRNA(adenine34) deaminase
MSMSEDEQFMRRAIAIAREAKQSGGGVPIGCVIVREGEVVGEGANEVATENDPTAHAEIVAIRAATKRMGADLRGTTLYSTLQPCGMCSMASIWSHVSRIVYSAEREQVHSMYFEDRHFNTMDFIRDAFRDDMTFTGGVLSAESVELYYKPGDDVPDEERGNT